MLVPVDKESEGLHFGMHMLAVLTSPKERILREMEEGIGGYWWKSPRDFSNLTERLKRQRMNK